MKCQDARRRMSAYLDSELDGETTFELNEHLQVCTACAERFAAEHRADLAMIRHLRSGAMPQGMRDSIRARVLAAKGHAPFPARRRLPGGWGLAAAAAVLVVSLGALLRGAGAREIPDPLRDYVEMTAQGSLVDWRASAVRQGSEVELPSGMRLRGGPEDQVHAIAFVGVQENARTGGFDVRLLCCGEPVLLRVMPAEEFTSQGGLALKLGEAGHGAWIQGDIHVSARRIGNRVAIAIARHPVEHVLHSALVS